MSPPVTIVVVGCRFGRHIVASLRESGPADGVRVVGVCDLNRDLAEAVAREFGLPAYPDIGAVLADPAVDGIGLFTGPGGRAELILTVVAAGKHIMTCKPFELDPAAAADALAAARAAGRVLHLNSPSPSPSADLVQIERWRVEHQLGAPVGAQAETWASYRESADGSWYDDPARCPVAPVLRLGVYLVNDLVRIFGPASTVQVVESRLFTGRPTTDNALLSIRFGNGALAAVSASFCVDDGQVYPDALVLSFERGTITRTTERDPRTPVARPQTKLTLTTKGPDGRPVREHATVREISGDYHWEAFAQAVRGEPGSIDEVAAGEHIIGGVQVLEAMARASRSGAAERVREYVR